MAKVRSFTVLPALPDSLKGLEKVARNMFWVWNPQLVDLFKRIDSGLWSASGHNPVRFLGGVSQKRFEELKTNKGFLSEVQRAVEEIDSYISGPTWFQNICAESEKTCVAYFSAEFGIHECLPIYSGGLGGLAGDHLKSASDLGIPLVGVGLLYQKGYFRQYLNIDGWQQELYIENDFHSMPVELIRGNDGQPLTISVDYPGETVLSQIWCVNVGRVKLYLLDTNIPANSASARMITSNLYGGDREMRIRQEIMLGIGGYRALRAIGISPAVCHMNEGHAAFMAIERIRQMRCDTDMSFEQALDATRSSNVFTIHTPVKAGLDEFSVDMMNKYFDEYILNLGISRDEFLGLGRNNVYEYSESFKMPILALKLSSFRNGVSKLHGEVSRRMWASIWPDVPVNEVPISSVTNGVHIKSWLSDEMNLIYERYFGSKWSDELVDKVDWDNIEQVPDEEIWRAHQRGKAHLIAFARKRLKAQMQRRGTYHTELNWAEEVLDPEALTIGFARRFATYKRGNLMLKDPERLVKLLSNPKRPVQIVFAGKAHPKDTEGKEIIRQIVHFASKYNVRRRIVFLEDYDINVARVLVRGVDVWLNTPRPPMEASGTSGMKAAINGSLNMSTLDGWWCEGYAPEVGWVIGSGETFEDAGYQDMVESQAIYNIFENEVVPLFYTRSADDLPRGWIYRMKKCIRRITPMFNTHRMLSEYTQNFYIPAGQKGSILNENDHERAKALTQWKADMRSAWPEIEIETVEMRVEGNDEGQLDPKQPQFKVGSELNVRALVNLGRVNPQDVSIELYHGQVDAWGNIEEGSAIPMDYSERVGESSEHWFEGVMRCGSTGQYGLAVRILPRNEDMVDPFELGLIHWESSSSMRGAITN